MNPQECVWEIRNRIIMKTVLQEKVRIHYSTIILVHKFIPMPQAMKIPAAKAAVDKEWEKWRKISAWNLTKVKSKKQEIEEARTAGRYSSFCIINGHLSSEKCWIGGKAPKIQRSSCTPRWYCKRQFRVARGDGVLKAGPETGGGGLARVPNLCVRITLLIVGGGTRRGGRMN